MTRQTTAERVRDMAVSQIAAEIDALTAERAAKDGVIREMWEAGNMAQTNIDSLKALLAEARAEVERLRPAAEAWEAYRAIWAAPFADPDKRDAAETRYQVAIAADSAARAAKENKG